MQENTNWYWKKQPLQQTIIFPTHTILHPRLNLTIWRQNDAFDILNDISGIFTLVQLMESLGNMNHAISIVGHWIFDSNYKK